MLTIFTLIMPQKEKYIKDAILKLFMVSRIIHGVKKLYDDSIEYNSCCIFALKAMTFFFIICFLYLTLHLFISSLVCIFLFTPLSLAPKYEDLN